MTRAAQEQMRGDAQPSLQERLRPPWRRRLRASRLAPALFLSTLFHLSMVTVFTVVIYFPRTEVKYYDFRIVPTTPTHAGAEDLAAAPGTGRGLGERLSVRGTTLPRVDLPTIEFAELERLRIAQEGMQSLSLYDQLYADRPLDSWARFGLGLQRLGRSISELTLSRGNGEEAPPPAPRGPQHRPAEGFEAEIYWSTGPSDRRLLFSPPITALQGVDPSTVNWPIEVVIEVDAQGRVSSVYSPQLDAGELLDAVQGIVLRQYRFEPLEGGGGVASRSMGTLYIRPAREARR